MNVHARASVWSDSKSQLRDDHTHGRNFGLDLDLLGLRIGREIEQKNGKR